MVDMVFDLHGEQLPSEHRNALWHAVRACLPWLEDIPEAGIHAIRAAQTTYGMALLPRRAKLVLRVPEARTGDAAALENAFIEVAGYPLRLGRSRCRELPLATTLYADFVSIGVADENPFIKGITAELSEIDIHCRFICGRRRMADELSGFAVAFHAVPLDRSRLLQRVGLGNGRKLGCGIPVQYKAITGLQ